MWTKKTISDSSLMYRGLECLNFLLHGVSLLAKLSLSFQKCVESGHSVSNSGFYRPCYQRFTCKLNSNDQENAFLLVILPLCKNTNLQQSADTWLEEHLFLCQLISPLGTKVLFHLFVSPASETNMKRTKWCLGESEFNNLWMWWTEIAWTGRETTR